MDECEIPDERPVNSIHPIHNTDAQKYKHEGEDQSMLQQDEECKNP